MKKPILEAGAQSAPPNMIMDALRNIKRKTEEAEAGLRNDFLPPGLDPNSEEGQGFSNMMGSISEGAVSGGMAPVGAANKVIKMAKPAAKALPKAVNLPGTEKLAQAIDGSIMAPNMGNGAILRAPARGLVEGSNAAPRVDATQLLDAIKAKFGNKLVR
jgi:hypothetical protein